MTKIEVNIQGDEGLTSIMEKSVKTMVGEKIENFTKEQFDTTLKGMIKNNIKDLAPNVVQVTGKKRFKKVNGMLHDKYSECLHICSVEKQLFISGPAGSGKTTMAKQISEGMGLEFASISCSFGMSEAHLMGRMLFDGKYVQSEFVKIYENGGVFLFDEIDAADPNTLLVINSALANGYMSVPNRSENPIAKRHDNFICIVSGNTWGDGSTDYSGRSSMDMAFLDRFALAKMEIDYCPKLERKISKDYAYLYEFTKNLRSDISGKSINKVFSTRSLVSCVKHLMSGKDFKWVKDVYFSDWSNDSLSRLSSSTKQVSSKLPNKEKKDEVPF